MTYQKDTLNAYIRDAVKDYFVGGNAQGLKSEELKNNLEEIKNFLTLIFSA